MSILYYGRQNPIEFDFSKENINNMHCVIQPEARNQVVVLGNRSTTMKTKPTLNGFRKNKDEIHANARP